jgi:hypothetical protein
MFFTVVIELELQAQSPAAAKLKLGNGAVVVIFFDTASEGMIIAIMISVENMKPHPMLIMRKIEDLLIRKFFIPIVLRFKLVSII